MNKGTIRFNDSGGSTAEVVITANEVEVDEDGEYTVLDGYQPSNEPGWRRNRVQSIRVRTALVYDVHLETIEGSR